MDYGLVLAGGGMRGAYQIGVWQALMEMNIKITAIAGTSIGAINGAMFAQGDYKNAEKLWREIRPEDIVSPSTDILKDGIADMKPLESLLRKVVNEDKIRKSPVDFGMAAFSLRDKGGICKFKSEIPHGKLIDYIMASACVPGVKARRVDGDILIDGGVSNNMPVNMLAKRNMKNIISVDIKGIGLNTDIDLSGKNVIEIVFEHPETGIAEVNSDGIRRSIRSGYIGCMRAFGRIEGEKYAVISESMRMARKTYSQKLISDLEAAAEIFDIDKYCIYSVYDLAEATLSAYREYEKTLDSADSAFEKILKLGDKAVTSYIIRNKVNALPLFPACRRAASAIKYFSEEK